MSDCAIKIDRLSKRYVIGHQPDARNGLRHALEDAFRNPMQWARTRALRRQNQESFWALRDVSFEINQGDVVGIIGRNGAGKSTLLKILSRITEPTQGVIDMNGRVASLLEVGTGFHQELTGRENIYLNGAILGMTRAEIKRKFDEIVAFSEVEKFLDTPVKRYSSGMYVRLAFAVAAHLEPEILIVDEVLAVGDAAFQKKCLGKMGEVAKGGRTVLFVSHNMAAVQSLCNTGVYLQNGTVRAVGEVTSLLQRYYADTAEPNSVRSDQLGEDITVLRLETVPRVVETGAPAVLNLAIRADKAVTIRELAILIHSVSGVRVGIIDLRAHGFPLSLDAGAEWEASIDVAAIPFVDGEYSLGLFCCTSNFQKNFPEIRSLTVTARAGGNTPYPAEYRGLVELQVEISTSHTGRTVAAAV